jgi:hypothetical protein
MSLIDRFRQQATTPRNNDRPARTPKPKRLRLEGQILRDDIFRASTDEP